VEKAPAFVENCVGYSVLKLIFLKIFSRAGEDGWGAEMSSAITEARSMKTLFR
jgi:hypothetical protein